MDGWINVNDRLPNDGEHVFFTDGGSLFYGECNLYEATAYWNIFNVIYGASNPNALPTHWTPRLELPKEN